MSDNIVPLRGLRAMTAEKLHRSLRDTAQVTHHADCDGSRLVAWKERLRASDEKVSIEDLLIHLAAATLRAHPELNGTLEGREIRLCASVHMSVAIALSDNRLVAPTIFEAERMSPPEIATARRDLHRRAARNQLSVAEMTGGTFTISNLGPSRVRHFTPILNAPQIAILGVGQLANRPWVGPEGGLAVRPVLGLSLTFDHRAVDGAPAAAFLSSLCASLEAAP